MQQIKSTYAIHELANGGYVGIAMDEAGDTVGTDVHPTYTEARADLADRAFHLGWELRYFDGSHTFTAEIAKSVLREDARRRKEGAR